MNKSLKAYNTGSELIFLILTQGKMIRVFLFQRVKEKVNGIFERFIILTDLHCVQHFYQCGKILFVCRGFIVCKSDRQKPGCGRCDRLPSPSGI